MLVEIMLAGDQFLSAFAVSMLIEYLSIIFLEKRLA